MEAPYFRRITVDNGRKRINDMLKKDPDDENGDTSEKPADDVAQFLKTP
jgi:hypothetical protein